MVEARAVLLEHPRQHRSQRGAHGGSGVRRACWRRRRRKRRLWAACKRGRCRRAGLVARRLDRRRVRRGGLAGGCGTRGRLIAFDLKVDLWQKGAHVVGRQGGAQSSARRRQAAGRAARSAFVKRTPAVDVRREPVALLPAVAALMPGRRALPQVNRRSRGGGAAAAASGAGGAAACGPLISTRTLSGRRRCGQSAALGNADPGKPLGSFSRGMLALCG